jgi:hypothetical protein
VRSGEYRQDVRSGCTGYLLALAAMRAPDEL